LADVTPDRDPAFWAAVCGEDFNPACLESPYVQPFRTENGGYLLVQLDALGRVYDLHAAYLPEGFGKEAHGALKGALSQLEGWQLINVSEVEGNGCSRPPLSFGFRPAGPMQGGFRTWFLSRAAWEQSPARRRME
jgi:hypothetical protein